MKSIVVGNTNGLKRGKTAIATALTRADTYRANGKWQSAQDLEHGTSVEAVNHFGRHTTERGEVLNAESIDGPTVKIKVVDIQAVEPDRLTESDFRALGYTDQADYMADWGEVFGSKVWLMKVQRV